MFNSKLAGLIAALWLALCAPAIAVIGTPVSIGGQGAHTSATCSFNTTTNIPAGSLVFGIVQWTTTNNATSVSSANIGGSGVTVDVSTVNQTIIPLVMDYAFVAFYNRGDASGTTYTITLNGSDNNSCDFWYVTGIQTTAAVDINTTSGPTTSTSWSISIGPLAQANEIAIACLITQTVTITAPGGSWSTLTFANVSQSAAHSSCSYQIVSSTSAVTGTYTLSGSKNWGATRTSFMGSATVSANSRSLTGVGQ